MDAIDEFGDDVLYNHANWALETGVWDGRHVTWDQLFSFQLEVEQKVGGLLFSQDPNSMNFQQMAAQFAWMGASPEERFLLARDIQQLQLSKDGVLIQTGLGKSFSKFWKKHKTAILIGVAVVVVVTAVVVITVCTSGTAGGSAAAAGGALLDNLANGGTASKSRDMPPVIAEKLPKEMDIAVLEDEYLTRLDEEESDLQALQARYETYTEAWERVLTGRALAGSSMPIFDDSLVPAVILLGDPRYQSTVHFHCGINNDLNSVVAGGNCLYNTLGEEFAIQPHLIHGPGLAKGLAMVGVEKAAAICDSPVMQAFVFATTIPQFVLEHSKIQESIDYEVSKLSQTAEEILSIGNPRLKQVHVTFSNGGYVFKEALKQLPPEHRDMIVVATLGTTAIIERDLACEVYNIIGDKDWPSKICNGGDVGIHKASEKADILVIPQTEAGGIVGGHFFMQTEYQEEIQKLIHENIENAYEIY